MREFPFCVPAQCPPKVIFSGQNLAVGYWIVINDIHELRVSELEFSEVEFRRIQGCFLECIISRAVHRGVSHVNMHALRMTANNARRCDGMDVLDAFTPYAPCRAACPKFRHRACGGWRWSWRVSTTSERCVNTGRKSWEDRINQYI